MTGPVGGSTPTPAEAIGMSINQIADAIESADPTPTPDTAAPTEITSDMERAALDAYSVVVEARGDRVFRQGDHARALRSAISAALAARSVAGTAAPMVADDLRRECFTIGRDTWSRMRQSPVPEQDREYERSVVDLIVGKVLDRVASAGSAGSGTAVLTDDPVLPYDARDRIERVLRVQGVSSGSVEGAAHRIMQALIARAGDGDE